MKKLILLTLALLFLLNVQAQNDNNCRLNPDSGKVQIVVFRPDKIIGRGITFPFGVDNKVFCTLKVNQFGYTNINPGKHLINGSKVMEGSYELTMSQDDILNIDFNSDYSEQIMNEKVYEAGKIYYYKVKTGLGSISIYARLEEISEIEAQKLLKKYNLSKKNKLILE